MKVPGIETAKVAKNLPFSLAEYQGRLARVREQMAERRLDVLVVTTPENIHYLSGYETPGYYCKQCLIVPVAGEPIHLTRGTEETNAKMRSWIDRTDSYMDHEDPVALFAETLRADGFARSRVGVEKISWFLTVADYEQLRASLPDAEIQDGSMLVEACRLIKSEAEIAYLRRAARAAEEGMTAALGTIRPGVTEDNVAADVQRAVTNAGSEYPSLPVFVASGVRSSLAHATWAGRRLEPGDPVMIEISGCVKRYSAALMRTASVGTPPERLQAMTDVSCRALEAMLAAIRPGRPLGEVWEVWAKAVDAGGFQGRFKRTGYSIGVNFPPDWGEGYILSFKRGETRPLRPNMTFHIPSIVKIFGFADAGTSETVRVTETGCELLTRFDRRLFVCPGSA
jgi:Xaa-Pro dipeptidase